MPPEIQLRTSKKDPWSIYKSLDEALILHCENVAAYTEILYRLAMEEDIYPAGLSKRYLIHVRNAVIYHDIGKSLIPGSILDKRGALTSDERAYIKKHVPYGLAIFQKTMESRLASEDSIIFLDMVIQSIAHHHERFDGNGYPGGLKGEEISIIGRMCSLCDFYDALTSSRPYRQALSHEEVLVMIDWEKGRMFQPELVELFMRHHEKFRKHRNHPKEQGRRI